MTRVHNYYIKNCKEGKIMRVYEHAINSIYNDC